MNILKKVLSGLLLAVTLAGPVAVTSTAITEQPAANAQQKASGGFKIGDRVLASPGYMKDDKYFRPCTITGVAANGYQVRCDPWNGSDTWMDFFVGSEYVRAWPNATAAPKNPECSFEVPAATVSKMLPRRNNFSSA
jgi:hypothetical protein